MLFLTLKIDSGMMHCAKWKIKWTSRDFFKSRIKIKGFIILRY